MPAVKKSTAKGARAQSGTRLKAQRGGPSKRPKAAAKRTQHHVVEGLPKEAPAKTLAFALYDAEVELLREAVRLNQEKGGRASMSQCVRWALHAVDWDDMPPVF